MISDDDSLQPLAKFGLTPTADYRITPPTGKTLKIAHISDTHLGLKTREVYVPDRDGKSRPATKQASSFQKFRGLLTTLQALDPDVIIHTGDVIDQEIVDQQARFNTFKSQFPNLTEERLFLYLRGNHDTHLSDVRIRQLFNGWDVLPLEDISPVSLADGQLTVVGRDYQNRPTPEAFDIDPLDNAEDSIIIGAFHQTIRRISRSYTADTNLTDLTPADKSITEYYNILLFGHMHTNYLKREEGCTILDGGSALGLDTASTMGLLTFSNGASHYQRFPLWVEDF
jgi:DNA repair exonuclease SbcCD nuclease subunit